MAKAPLKKTNNKSKLYKVIIYDSFVIAKKNTNNIKTMCNDCDQLNVVIKEEGNMDDKDLLGIDNKVKVYAGEAWTTIHERRIEENWYFDSVKKL